MYNPWVNMFQFLEEQFWWPGESKEGRDGGRKVGESKEGRERKDEREGWRRKEGERMKGWDGGRKGRRKDERVG